MLSAAADSVSRVPGHSAARKPEDRGMIHAQSALSHHLFQVAVAQGGAKVPTYAQENNLGFEVAPFERTRVLHEGNSFGVLE